MKNLPVAALFVLACLNRISLIGLSRFDGLYGQDAYAYYDYARELFASLSQFQVPPPFWWPLGYPALLSLGFLFGGVTIGTAQAITVLSGALIAPFAYLLAREGAPQGHKPFAAWTAGLICAAGAQLAQSSVVVMADAPALLFATLGAWLLLRYARTGKLATLSLASFAAGIAVWTRWQNLIVLGAWALALIASEWSRASPAGHNRTGLRAVGHILLAFAIVGLVLAPQFFLRSSSNTPLAGQSWLEGWSPANFFARTFDNVDGHFEYTLPVAIFYGQVFVHPAYLFALLTPLFLTGIGGIARRLNLVGKAFGLVRMWSAPEHTGALLLLVWVGGMFLFLAGIPYENFRFSLGLFVPVAVVTGLGSAQLWNRFATSRVRFLLAGWIAVGLLVMVLWQPRVLAPILEIKARELDQARWLEQQIPPTAVVWTLGQNGALDTYTQLRTASIWNISAAELRASAPAYLFVDTENLETQWRGTPVQDLFETLHAGGHLLPAGAREEYELFRIE